MALGFATAPGRNRPPPGRRRRGAPAAAAAASLAPAGLVGHVQALEEKGADGVLVQQSTRLEEKGVGRGGEFVHSNAGRWRAGVSVGGYNDLVVVEGSRKR